MKNGIGREDELLMTPNSEPSPSFWGRPRQHPCERLRNNLTDQRKLWRRCWGRWPIRHIRGRRASHPNRSVSARWTLRVCNRIVWIPHLPSTPTCPDLSNFPPFPAVLPATALPQSDSLSAQSALYPSYLSALRLRCRLLPGIAWFIK